MNMLPTTLALDNRLKVIRAKAPGLIIPVSRAKPKKVTEAEYWEKYYDDPDVIYEWNNGYLEEKPVSDHENYVMYWWFIGLLSHFLQINPIAKTTGLEMGFRLSHQSQIRRPDLGVVLNTNPVPLYQNDHTYQGICDMCVEAISDSKRSEIERDTKTKFLAYQAVGVKEYYILYAKRELMAFYSLNQQGVYVPIKPVKGDLIQSQVLSGFQFRIEDLFNQPSAEQMGLDPVYNEFVIPQLKAEKMARQKAERLFEQERQRADKEAQRAKKEAQRAKKEAQRADKEAQRAEKEAQKAQEAEAEVAHLKALLANQDNSQG